MKRIGIHSKDVAELPIVGECPIEYKPKHKSIALPDVSRFDVSKLESLNSKLNDIKQSNKSNDFIEQINHVLDLFDVDDLKYSHEIVFFVMTESEKFLLVSKSGEQKKDIVVDVCKRFFNDDPALVRLVVELLIHKLPQVKMFGRIVRRVYRWALKKVQNKSYQQSK
jgi:hypothetical protein